MTVVAHFVRTAMTAIAVNDSRVARGNPAEPNEKPERQNQSESNPLHLPHFDAIAILTRLPRNHFARGIVFTPYHSGSPFSRYII